MNYVVLTGKDEGLDYFLKKALDPIGKTVWISNGSRIADQVTEQLAGHDGSPIVVVMNLEDDAFKDWKRPIAGFLNSKSIGGCHFPDSTSIIVVSELSRSKDASKALTDAGISGKLIITKHSDLRDIAREVGVPESEIHAELIAYSTTRLTIEIAHEIMAERIENDLVASTDPALRQFVEKTVESRSEYAKKITSKIIKSLGKKPSIIDNLLERFF